MEPFVISKIIFQSVNVLDCSKELCVEPVNLDLLYKTEPVSVLMVMEMLKMFAYVWPPNVLQHVVKMVSVSIKSHSAIIRVFVSVKRDTPLWVQPNHVLHVILVTL